MTGEIDGKEDSFSRISKDECNELENTFQTDRIQTISTNYPFSNLDEEVYYELSFEETTEFSDYSVTAEIDYSKEMKLNSRFSLYIH